MLLGTFEPCKLRGQSESRIWHSACSDTTIRPSCSSPVIRTTTSSNSILPKPGVTIVPSSNATVTAVYPCRRMNRHLGILRSFSQAQHHRLRTRIFYLSLSQQNLFIPLKGDLTLISIGNYILCKFKF